MHRTTILLPPELRQAAEREAREMGVSLGELIRRRLRPALKKQEPQVPGFFTRVPWTGSGPRDLSANHDKYLYDS